MFNRNVRAQIHQHPPQGFSDSRLQQTPPQPIPPTPGSLNPLQRGPSAVPRNFSAYSPAQSPQQHASYMYMNPNDANVSSTSIITQSPSAKPNSNGQHMWSMQQMPYQQQHPQQQNIFSGNPSMASKFPRPHQSSAFSPGFSPNTSAMASSSTPSLYYNPGTTPMRPQQRFSSNSNPSMLTPSGQSPNFFSQAPQSYYHPSNQVPQVPGYAPTSQYDHGLQYQASNQHLMPPPNMMQSQSIQMPMQPQQQPQQTPMMQQTIPQQAAPHRKKITIKDPNTLEDVTRTVLQSGRQSEIEHGSVRPPSVPSFQQQQPPPKQIAAQFAAQVAAAASGTSERPPHANIPPLTMASGQGDISRYPPRMSHPIKSVSPVGVPIIPSGLDTSVPPPPLKTIQTQMPLSQGSAAMHGSNRPLLPMQTPPGSYIKAPNLMPASPAQKQLASGNAIPSIRPNTTNVTAPPDAPIAVQPAPSAKLTDLNCKLPSSIPLKGDSPISNVEEPPSELNDDALRNIAHNQAKQSENSKAVELTTPRDVDVSSPKVEDVSTLTHADEAPSERDISSVTAGVAAVTVEDESQPGEICAPTPDIVVKPAAETTLTLDENDVNVLEEQGDVIYLETAKDESEVNQLSENPLSGGDSALKDSNDRIPRKSPEGEAISEQEKSSRTKEEPLEFSRDLEPVSNSESSIIVDSDVVAADMEMTPNDQNYEMELNTSGKKVYPRDFLLQFRFHSASMEKPADLPFIEDIIRDSPLPKSSISPNLPFVGFPYRDSSPDFTPSWMRGSGSKGGRQASRGGRTGQQRPGYGMGYHSQSGPPKIITKSIQKEPELNKAENAWKPSKLESKPANTVQTEEEQTEEVLRNVRAILNKLTPQKFQALLQKFQQLPINSEVRLREVTNLIFEKAIDEPSFCEAYANMCRVMSQFKVSTKATTAAQAAAAGPQSTVEFRKVLLTRCQREFEKDRTNEDILGDLRKKVEEAKTAEEKQQLKEDLDYQEAKTRRRMLGNIRFIGELFKLQMLTESIMHNCLMSLFRKRDDESLESLCRLLMTIGKDLDHPKGKPRMEQYFAQIEKIISEKKTSSRVRFMLKDVVDLRLNKWVPRAIQAQGPKTIDQIHQDAKEEKEQRALQQAAAAAAAPVKSQSRGNRMGSRGGGGHNPPDDGWTKVQQKPIRIDPSKMKLSKYDESMTLGPNRGKVGWKSGSGSGTTRTGSGGYSVREALDSITPRSSTPTTMNRFSALGGGTSEYQRSGRISSQERTKNDSRGSTGSGRGVVREDRQSALNPGRKQASVERKPMMSANSKDRSLTKAPSPTPAVKLDTEVINKKLNSIITEYLCIRDIKEARECFDELNLPAQHQYMIVQACLEVSLEKKSDNRLSVSRLLSALVQQGKIPTDQYIAGVVNNMELAAELELDLPKVWSCLAELLAPIFYDSAGKIPLVFLRKMTPPLLSAGKAHVFVAEILKFLIKEKGLDVVLQQWRENELSMDDFTSGAGPTDIADFLQRQNLLDFYKAVPANKFEFFRANISKQLLTNASDEAIADWICRHLSRDNKLDVTALVRALTTAAFEFAIVKKDEENFAFDKKLLSSRMPLLKEFIDDDAKELEALYALQRLYVQLEQPANLLKLIFDHIYEEDLISEQTFYKWETDQNPLESEGKGVTLLSVRSFLTWLHEAENESDE